jgi:hypothetical protein
MRLFFIFVKYEIIKVCLKLDNIGHNAWLHVVEDKSEVLIEKRFYKSLWDQRVGQNGVMAIRNFTDER